MPNRYEICVVIITKGRKPELEKCVTSLVLPGYAELIVVANGFNEETFGYLRQLGSRAYGIKCLFFEERLPKSEARNTGIRNADSDIVYFLDDDSYPAGGNIELLKKKFDEHPDIDIIGGPNLTPPGSTVHERVSGYAFSEAFTSWKMRERFSKGSKEKICDDSSVTLCNLAFRKNIFDKENVYFDRRLYYNEENLLLEQYLVRGHKILYCPELVVYHHRRKNLLSLAEQIFRSGEGRAVMTRIMPKSLKPVYLAPALFVVYLAVPVMYGKPLFTLPFYLYLLFVLMNAVSITIRYREKLAALPLLMILPFVAHISYGIGFLTGLFKKHNG